MSNGDLLAGCPCACWSLCVFAYLAVMWLNSDTSGQPSVNCSWLPGMRPLTSLHRVGTKPGLSWSCLFIGSCLVGSFVRVSPVGWFCFVQVIGSLCSLFLVFNWFWALIKCNLSMSGSPYVPVLGTASRIPEAVAGATVKRRLRKKSHLGEEEPDVMKRRAFRSWSQYQRANTHFENILYSRLFGSGRLSGGSWHLTVVSGRCACSHTSSCFSPFLLCLMLKFIWFSDSSCI